MKYKIDFKTQLQSPVQCGTFRHVVDVLGNLKSYCGTAIIKKVSVHMLLFFNTMVTIISRGKKRKKKSNAA